MDENNFIDSSTTNPNRLLNAKAQYVVEPAIDVDGVIDPGFIYVNCCFGVAKLQFQKRTWYALLASLTLLFLVLIAAICTSLLLDIFRDDSIDVGDEYFSSLPSLLPSSSPSKISLSPSTTSLSPSSYPTSIVSNQPSAQTLRVKSITSILLNVSGNILLKQDSFQNKALDWILHEDNNDTNYTDESLVVQRYGAMLFYFSLHGESWHNADGYGSGSNVCFWYGVTCSLIPNEGSEMFPVWSLIIDSNNLRGEIPEEIGIVFPQLRDLNLGCNLIEGSLPKSMFRLEKMRDIRLFQNNLTGRLPDNLGNLRYLRTLRLSDNFLEGSIPTTIKNNVDLIQLLLANNLITGSIPTELFGLKSIEDITLRQNLLTNTLPTGLAYDSLWCLHLYGNGMNGTLPDELLNGRNLVELDLNDNVFTGTMPEIVNKASWLIKLDLHNNQVRGTIPESWVLLTKLEILHLSENNFEGTIPTAFGELANLMTFHLYCSELTGSVPTEIGSLTKLQHLRLSKNMLSGTMPLEICALGLMTLVYNCDCSCCTECV